MAQARSTWLDVAAHPTGIPEVYSDLEGNVRVSWPIPDLEEGSRLSIALPHEEARSLARAITNECDIAASNRIDGPTVAPLYAAEG